MTQPLIRTIARILKAFTVSKGASTVHSGSYRPAADVAEDIFNNIFSTTGHPGIVELATGPETIAVTDQERAVTPYALGAALAKLKVISFTGVAAAGPCTVVGAALGDVIFCVTGTSGVFGVKSTSFEAIVTVAGQIRQSEAADLHLNTYTALLFKPS